MDNFKTNLLTSLDATALYALMDRNRERLRRYFPITVYNTDSLEKAMGYVAGFQKKIENRQMFPMGIFKDDLLIGMIYVKSVDWRILRCELGYFIDEDFEGKGVVTNIIEKIKTFCFNDLGLNKIFLRISPDNIGSIRIAEKTGFKKEGVLRKEFRIETGELIDVVYFVLLKSEFVGSN